MKSASQPQHPSPGKLYGVGAGPGAPDLLTLRAKRVIQACPVICLPGRQGASAISANLGDWCMQGTEGDARSPLRHGWSIGTMPYRSGDLASPVCPTRTDAPEFALMGATAVRANPQPCPSSFPPSYAGSIIEHLIDHTRQEVLLVQFPMQRDPAQARPARARAADRVLERLSAGYDVAFVTEGDPLLYSTFSYILEAVKQQCPAIPIEVVPGVSSITAAAAAAAIPLAAWDEQVAIVPAVHVLNDSGSNDLRMLLRIFDTVVLLKVHTVFAALLDILEELGLAKHAVFVRRCSTDLEEVVFDLACLRNQSLDYFSLVIVRNPYCQAI